MLVEGRDGQQVCTQLLLVVNALLLLFLLLLSCIMELMQDTSACGQHLQQQLLHCCV
jgi:hypothetical protein